MKLNVKKIIMSFFIATSSHKSTIKSDKTEENSLSTTKEETNNKQLKLPKI